MANQVAAAADAKFAALQEKSTMIRMTALSKPYSEMIGSPPKLRRLLQTFLASRGNTQRNAAAVAATRCCEIQIHFLGWIICDGAALGDYTVHVEPIDANRRATYNRNELFSETGIPVFCGTKGAAGAVRR